MKSAIGCTVAAMLVAAACGTGQADYEETADRALSNAALDQVDADYDDDARTIHLTGTVTTEDDRQRAADVVQKAVGDGAQVANEVVVAGAEEATAGDLDSGLEDQLDDLVQNERTLADDDITFDVNNAVVTITGSVDSREERDRVGDLARSQPGVRDVVNSVEVQPDREGTDRPKPSAPAQRAPTR